MCGQFYLPNGLHLQQIWIDKIILHIVPQKQPLSYIFKIAV